MTQKTIVDAWGDRAPARDFSFALVYIDGDSIPELVLTEYCTDCWIYTYRDGKAKGSLMQGDILSYYKKTGVVMTQEGVHGGGDETYYRLSKGKISELCYSVWFGKNRDYYQGRKEISKSTFNSRIKKLVGSKKKTRLTLGMFHKNTSANRSKYLK